MNFSRIFIERPIMTSLVMIGILLFGVVGYIHLPVSDLPSVDFPTIQVSASLPGANPDTMAASVATPLEQQFTTIAGIDSMNSTSQLGSTSITLQFNLNRNIDAAAQDVQAAISTAQAKLPTDMPTPPTLRKVNPADSPILFLAVSSPYMPMYKVDEYAETMIAQRLSMVTGVAQVMGVGVAKICRSDTTGSESPGHPELGNHGRHDGRSRPAMSTCRRGQCTVLKRPGPSRSTVSSPKLRPLIIWSSLTGTGRRCI